MKEQAAIIVMGVSGSGKSTLGEQLAAELNVPFLEGDRFHPAANVAKMAAGIALQDEDRWPWLKALGSAIAAQRAPSGVVAACSALKRTYRDCLRRIIGEPLIFVCLVIDRSILRKRLHSRPEHFMPPSLLDSQLQSLEIPGPDETAIVLRPAGGAESLLGELLTQLSRRFRVKKGGNI
jgi:gluconokinase